MNNLTFTLMDLGLFFIFIFGIAACIAIIVLVININKTAVDLKDLIGKNKENLDKTLNDLPVITANVAELSETAKSDVQAFEKKFLKIGSSGDAPEAAAAGIIERIAGIIDIAEFLLQLFTSKSKSKKETKAALKSMKIVDEKKEIKLSEEPPKEEKSKK